MESKVIIHGIDKFCLFSKVKIYFNDEYIGLLKRGETIRRNINDDVVIKGKVNIIGEEFTYEVKKGNVTRLKVSYDRLLKEYSIEEITK